MNTQPHPDADIDRVRELVSVGAGHAATALARLTGRTCEMAVPTVHTGRSEPGGAADRELSGVLFELEGGTGGVLALLFPKATRAKLLEHLLGPGLAAASGEAAHSALREVGNILASHAANAVGEMLGETILPSVPMLELDDALAALARLVAKRHGGATPIRFETEIHDRAHELRGILVLVPDPTPHVAAAARV